MWTDYYLKFADEAEFAAHMPEELMLPASESHATDIVGILYNMETYQPLPGYHVNLRLREGTPLPAALETYSLPAPALPKRVFA